MRRAAGACALILALVAVVAVTARGGGASRQTPLAAPAPSLPRTERILIPPTVPEPPPTTVPEPPAPAAPALVVDWDLWQRIHQCEQADSWYAYGRFGNGLQGGGGLGMSDGAWSMAVSAARKWGIDLPGFVLDATPEQQMQAAQAFLNTYGWAWGCH